MHTYENLIISTVLGMLEYGAFILICLALWKIKFSNKNIKRMIIFSLILSILSYLCSISEQSISVFVSITAFYLVFKLLFRKKALFTLLIVASGYASGVLIQVAIAVVLLKAHAIESFQDIQPFTIVGYSLQVALFLISAAIAYMLKSSNLGFDFNPDETFTKKQIKFTNKLLMTVSIIILILINVMYFIVQNFNISSFILLFLFIASVVVIIYLDNKRDDEEFA